MWSVSSNAWSSVLMALFSVEVKATSNLNPSAATNRPASVASSWPFSDKGQSYQPAREYVLDGVSGSSACSTAWRRTAACFRGCSTARDAVEASRLGRRRRRPPSFRAVFNTSKFVLEVPGRLAVAHHDDRRLPARAGAQGALGGAEQHRYNLGVAGVAASRALRCSKARLMRWTRLSCSNQYQRSRESGNLAAISP